MNLMTFYIRIIGFFLVLAFLLFSTFGSFLSKPSFAQESVIDIEKVSSITGKVSDTENKSLKCKNGETIPISIFYFEATSDEGTGNLIGDWKLTPVGESKTATGQIIGGSTNDNQFQLNTVIDKWLKGLCTTDSKGTVVTITGQCGLQGNIKFVSQNGSHYEAPATIECN
jgi:hypothetical protein